MVCTGSIQDAFNLVDLAIRPLLVHWSSILEDRTPNAQQTQRNNSFLVNNIVFVAESINRDTGC